MIPPNARTDPWFTMKITKVGEFVNTFMGKPVHSSNLSSSWTQTSCLVCQKDGGKDIILDQSKTFEENGITGIN